MAVLTVEASSPSTVNKAWFSSTFRWTPCHWPSLRPEPAGEERSKSEKQSRSTQPHKKGAEPTRRNVDARVPRLRQGGVDDDLALGQPHLHPALGQRGEHQQPAGVPGPEGEADRQRVAGALARQLQEGRGVEKDGEGVGFGAGEGQVALR